MTKLKNSTNDETTTTTTTTYLPIDLEQTELELNKTSFLTSNECLSFYMPDLNIVDDNKETNAMLVSMSKQKERANVLKEILTSEKKYLNDLREIVQVREKKIYFYIYIVSLSNAFLCRIVSFIIRKINLYNNKQE
jgi:hypothetical protein